MNKWFSVEKTNPITSGWYLANILDISPDSYSWGNNYLDVIYHNGVSWINPFSHGGEITHWTHLPDKPNEDNVDNECS